MAKDTRLGGADSRVVKLWDPRYTTPAQTKALALLPDPTARDRSKRPRGVHAMVEQPSSGDLHMLTSDSKIHVVRPSAGLCMSAPVSETILPVQYTHPMLQSTYWMRLAFSPCGRYLASGSSRGGLMTWDTERWASPFTSGPGVRMEHATRLDLGPSFRREREISTVDWGYDMVSTSLCHLRRLRCA